MMLHDITPPPGGLRFSARTENGYTIAALSGELDIACTPVLREQLLNVLRPRASRLVVDLSEVSFCDASGLAVLVGTGRRARLPGGMLRLAAPARAVTAALRISARLRQFDIFPTALVAIAQPQTAKNIPDTSTQLKTSSQTANGGSATQAAITPAADAPTPTTSAVPALLARADAWRDADLNRRFTSPLRALARAQACDDQAALTKDDHVALTEAARSLPAALTRVLAYLLPGGRRDGK